MEERSPDRKRCQSQERPRHQDPSWSDNNNKDEGGQSSSSSDSGESSGWDYADDETDDNARSRRSSSLNSIASPSPPTVNPSIPDTSVQEVGAAEADAATATSVSVDRERQILLLILLGQVCALHDPTPRAFTAHILELFERGILDRESIHFLYKHGLVPYSSPPTKLLLPPPPTSTDGDDEEDGGAERAIVTLRRERSMEVSAIRSSLEQQEVLRRSHRSGKAPAASVVERHNKPVSFSAEHHPLSLSRFQREFDHIRLISSGAFGTVYQATSKMDGREYAIKRVEFTALGYAQDSMQQVIREVHCLAACDHVNVVRYYTSWMEPSWMTGASTVEEAGRESTNHVQRLVTAEYNNNPETQDGIQDNFFKSTASLFKPRHGRRYSWGEDESSYMEDCSDWSVEYSKDDSALDYTAAARNRLSRGQKRSKNKKDEAASFYRYQICLFIQMQLCKVVTLADWIRERNCTEHTLGTRLDMASRIFTQMCLGLAHVHDKGIIHRDLKPANVFVSHEADGLNFKIGDFGLSKLIQSTIEDIGTNGGSPKHSRNSHRVIFEEFDEEGNLCALQPDDQVKYSSHHRDPLTAGVGTASYASPEQVNSRAYESSVDIFSLGLILLELLCCFSTEHERLKVFRECRQSREIPDELHEFPTAATVILACTEHVASRRPTAIELSEIDLKKDDSRVAPNKDDEVQQLVQQLLLKDREIEGYKQQLEEKQGVIDGLLRDVQRLKGGLPATKIYSFATTSCFTAENEISHSVLASSSSSSSEDEL